MNHAWAFISNTVWRVAVWDANRRRAAGHRVCNCRIPHEREKEGQQA